VTEKADMAIVPEVVAVNDVIILLNGDPTLVVLTDVVMAGERVEAKLVDERYVYGLMEGQLKDKYNEVVVLDIALIKIS
jgi:hypothetical protein